MPTKDKDYPDLLPMAREETQWLMEELPKWVEKGLLSAEQAQGIRDYYEQEARQPAYQLGFILLGITAALLTGSGLILVVANNWSAFGPGLRTLISFFPLTLGLILYGYALFRQSDSLAWRESASGFLMLMLAASLGLLAQTWQILLAPEQFLVTWLILSWPLLYLLRSSLCAVLYFWGAMAWALQVGYQESLWYWLLYAAGLPHFIWLCRAKAALLQKNILEWTLLVSLLISWFALVEADLALYGIWGTALLLSVFFGLGKEMESRANLWVTPFQLLPILGLFLIVLILSFGPDVTPFRSVQWFRGYRFPPSTALVNGIVLATGCLAWLYFLWQSLAGANRAAWTWSQRAIILLPVGLFLVILLGETPRDDAARLFVNLLGMVLGILFLREGIRDNAMVPVNIGMLFILTLLVVRFFDEEWNLLVKGLVFIGIGLSFLGANILLYRRFRRTGQDKNT